MSDFDVDSATRVELIAFLERNGVHVPKSHLKSFYYQKAVALIAELKEKEKVAKKPAGRRTTVAEVPAATDADASSSSRASSAPLRSTRSGRASTRRATTQEEAEEADVTPVSQTSSFSSRASIPTTETVSSLPPSRKPSARTSSAFLSAAGEDFFNTDSVKLPSTLPPTTRRTTRASLPHAAATAPADDRRSLRRSSRAPIIEEPVEQRSSRAAPSSARGVAATEVTEGVRRRSSRAGAGMAVQEIAEEEEENAGEEDENMREEADEDEEDEEEQEDEVNPFQKSRTSPAAAHSRTSLSARASLSGRTNLPTRTGTSTPSGVSRRSSGKIEISPFTAAAASRIVSSPDVEEDEDEEETEGEGEKQEPVAAVGTWRRHSTVSTTTTTTTTPVSASASTSSPFRASTSSATASPGLYTRYSTSTSRATASTRDGATTSPERERSYLASMDRVFAEDLKREREQEQSRGVDRVDGRSSRRSSAYGTSSTYTASSPYVPSSIAAVTSTTATLPVSEDIEAYLSSRHMADRDTSLRVRPLPADAEESVSKRQAYTSPYTSTARAAASPYGVRDGTVKEERVGESASRRSSLLAPTQAPASTTVDTTQSTVPSSGPVAAAAEPAPSAGVGGWMQALWQRFSPSKRGARTNIAPEANAATATSYSIRYNTQQHAAAAGAGVDASAGATPPRLASHAFSPRVLSPLPPPTVGHDEPGWEAAASAPAAKVARSDMSPTSLLFSPRLHAPHGHGHGDAHAYNAQDEEYEFEDDLSTSSASAAGAGVAYDRAATSIKPSTAAVDHFPANVPFSPHSSGLLSPLGPHIAAANAHAQAAARAAAVPILPPESPGSPPPSRFIQRLSFTSPSLESPSQSFITSQSRRRSGVGGAGAAATAGGVGANGKYFSDRRVSGIMPLLEDRPADQYSDTHKPTSTTSISAPGTATGADEGAHNGGAEEEVGYDFNALVESAGETEEQFVDEDRVEEEDAESLSRCARITRTFTSISPLALLQLIGAIIGLAALIFLCARMLSTYTSQVYCDSTRPPPVPVFLASRPTGSILPFSLSRTTEVEYHSTDTDFERLVAESGVNMHTAQCVPCPSLAFCVQGHAHCPAPFGKAKAGCEKGDDTCVIESVCSDEHFLSVMAEAVHTHAGRYDCQGTPSPITALRALASITLEDICAALSHIPFVNITANDLPLPITVVLKVFSWFFGAGLWIAIAVLSLIWPPHDIPPPPHRFVLFSELLDYITVHFPAVTELALPALGNHFVRSMLAHKEFKVEVLPYQSVLSSPLSLRLDGTSTPASTTIDPNSHTFVSLAPARPLFCALRYMMFEPMFLIGLAIAVVALGYCIKRWRVYRHARAAEDARLTAANYVIARLKEAARDSVTAQGKAHARYHQEVTAKRAREEALRNAAAQENWSAEKLATEMQNLHARSLRLADIVASAKRLALVRCGVLQEEVEKDLGLGKYADLWSDVYHRIDNDRRIVRLQDREGMDNWKWEGQKDRSYLHTPAPTSNSNAVATPAPAADNGANDTTNGNSSSSGGFFAALQSPFSSRAAPTPAPAPATTATAVPRSISRAPSRRQSMVPTALAAATNKALAEEVDGLTITAANTNANANGAESSGPATFATVAARTTPSRVISSTPSRAAASSSPAGSANIARARSLMGTIADVVTSPFRIFSPRKATVTAAAPRAAAAVNAAASGAGVPMRGGVPGRPTATTTGRAPFATATGAGAVGPGAGVGGARPIARVGVSQRTTTSASASASASGASAGAGMAMNMGTGASRPSLLRPAAQTTTTTATGAANAGPGAGARARPLAARVPSRASLAPTGSISGTTAGVSVGAGAAGAGAAGVAGVAGRRPSNAGVGNNNRVSGFGVRR